MCEYCRTTLDIDGSTIPAGPKPIINEKWSDLGVEVRVLVESLFVNIDIYDENEEQMPWKLAVTPINYCPMCGEKLSEDK